MDVGVNIREQIEVYFKFEILSNIYLPCRLKVGWHIQIHVTHYMNLYIREQIHRSVVTKIKETWNQEKM